VAEPRAASTREGDVAGGLRVTFEVTFRAGRRPTSPFGIGKAAVLLGETRSTLYRAIKAGTFPLPIFRIGQRIRIPRRSVERLLDGLPLTPPEEASPARSHPSTWSRDQPDPPGAPDPVAPEDSVFPT